MPNGSPVVGSRRVRRRPAMVRLSLGRFVGGHPVVFGWVVEDGERWGQQEAILITTGSACLIHGAGGESEQLVEDLGRWVVRQRAQRSADHPDAGGQPAFSAPRLAASTRRSPRHLARPSRSSKTTCRSCTAIPTRLRS